MSSLAVRECTENVNQARVYTKEYLKSESQYDILVHKYEFGILKAREYNHKALLTGSRQTDSNKVKGRNQGLVLPVQCR